MFARRITRLSSEVSAIHLASTSSEAGRRPPAPPGLARSGNSTQYSLRSCPVDGTYATIGLCGETREAYGGPGLRPSAPPPVGRPARRPAPPPGGEPPAPGEEAGGGYPPPLPFFPPGGGGPAPPLRAGAPATGGEGRRANPPGPPHSRRSAPLAQRREHTRKE